MLKLRVSNEVRKERWDTCKSCKFFVAETGSCGPLITGRKLTKEETAQLEVRHYKKKVKLCGCVMKLKTFLPFASCPADKWKAIEMNGVTPQRVAEKKEEILNFLNRIRDKSSLANTEVKELIGFIAWLYNKRVEFTTCPPCIIAYINDLKKRVQEI